MVFIRSGGCGVIHHKQLRELVIRPVLESFDLHSQSAENLLVLTACVESACGKWLHQNGGPALGIFQMEPATHDDIHMHFLPSKPHIRASLHRWSVRRSCEEMIWNLAYAALMCRLHYLRDRKPLPQADDIPGLAAYWKRVYNTHLGKGRVEDAVDLYEALGVV